MQSLSLGAADFAASMGMQTTGIGGTQTNYYMIENGEVESDRAIHFPDPWHTVTTSIVAACRANGLLPVDGPFGDFSDQKSDLTEIFNFQNCEFLVSLSPQPLT